MTTKQDAYQKPVFSEELFQSYYPMIVDIIQSEMKIMKKDSQLIEDFDDIVSRCRFWFYEHIEKYDPTRLGKNGRPQKFSTFINMVMRSRVGSIRVNNRRITEKNTCINWTSFQDIIQKSNDVDSDELDISYAIDSNSLVEVDTLELKMNLEKIKQELDELHYQIYCDLYIYGYKQKEVAEKFSLSAYNKKEIFKNLQELHLRFFGV